MFRLNPLTLENLKRFRSLRRGYWSFIIMMLLIFLSLVAELFVNSRALVVRYDSKLYFPVYGAIIPGARFGLGYDYETDYRQLKKQLSGNSRGDFVIMPPIPYNPYETDFIDGSYPPFPPSIERRHFLGTDRTGRDIAARLIYGFRISIIFSLILLVFNYAIGISVGSLMGYLGGRFDLFFQRIIEIWNNIPYLYAIIIISSIIIPNFFSLLGIMIFFGWIGITWYMRTAVYSEREREYVLAAKAMGASTFRIIAKHIIPNTLSVIITFIPFAVAGGITALTALDYLGFGLAPPVPSWGQLLAEASQYNIAAPWIGISVITALVIVLSMVTFIGESVREAYDPKKFTTYE
ncbi:MAG: ABC transporter permease subunit [Spirochaetes bacterium]|nr:ABC transporter permease subunit [Spirochaetota bacterium]